MSNGSVLALPKVPRANPGDKKGWVTRSGQVPPEVAERFDALTAELRQTDAVCLAISEYVERREALPAAA